LLSILFFVIHTVVCITQSMLSQDVCLSVMFRFCAKMLKSVIKVLLLPDSAIVSVFQNWTLFQNWFHNQGHQIKVGCWNLAIYCLAFLLSLMDLCSIYCTIAFLHS